MPNGDDEILEVLVCKSCGKEIPAERHRTTSQQCQEAVTWPVGAKCEGILIRRNVIR